MSHLESGDTLCAWLERRSKAKAEAKRSRYKPVTVNLTSGEYESLQVLLNSLQERKLLGARSGSRGLVLKRALKVYSQHVAKIPESGLEYQNEQGALNLLRQRKANASARRRGL